MHSHFFKEATVLWYNRRKGYGFIKVDQQDVFIHRKTLEFFGLFRIEAQDRLIVTMSENTHGLVVNSVVSVFRPSVPVPKRTNCLDDSEVLGKVKFFSGQRGYGFIEVIDDHSEVKEDAYFDYATLRKAGLATVGEGQELALVLCSEDQERGRFTAKSIRLFVREH